VRLLSRCEVVVCSTVLELWAAVVSSEAFAIVAFFVLGAYLLWQEGRSVNS
jgi:hypothetical protein